MNPYGNMSTSHSMWPVLLSIMNLPPWLCNKRKYIMLSTLVSGLKQPGDRIDVFLQPLVEDLQVLWDGVEVRDAVVNKHFTLHAMLMTTFNDNPAHHNLSGQSKRKGQGCSHSCQRHVPCGCRTRINLHTWSTDDGFQGITRIETWTDSLMVQGSHDLL